MDIQDNASPEKEWGDEQPRPEPGPVMRPLAETGRAYRFCRALVRLWFALSFRKIRLLGRERLLDEGPMLLAIGHPAGFLDALILVSAFDRPVSCLIPVRFVQRFWPRLWARWLNMIPYESANDLEPPVLDACVDTLADEGVLAVFAEVSDDASADSGGLAKTAAAIAATATARGARQVPLFPIHLFLPVRMSQAAELLIYVDPPLFLEEQDLAPRLESRWKENPFRLQADDLELFLADMEDLLRANLEEEWASRPNWKQKTDEFQLSAYVAAWAEQANSLHPGRLVSLREILEDFREGLRRGALHQAEVEAAHDWLGSPLHRGWVWFESLLGFPVALIGLGNHLLAFLALSWTRLLKPNVERDLRTEWLLRGAVVVGCYAAQVLLVAYLWGRSTAGYYAPALPLTGLYLWRYRWLLRHRTHLAVKSLLLPWHDRRLRHLRRRFVAELDKTILSHAEQTGVMTV